MQARDGHAQMVFHVLIFFTRIEGISRRYEPRLGDELVGFRPECRVTLDGMGDEPYEASVGRIMSAVSIGHVKAFFARSSS